MQNCRLYQAFDFVLTHLMPLVPFYNLGQSICRLFHVIAQFVFTTSEAELDYYKQTVNSGVALRVAEQPKTWDLRKLGNFKKIPEMLWTDGEYPAG